MLSVCFNFSFLSLQHLFKCLMTIMFLHMHFFKTIISLVCTKKSSLLGLLEILGTVVLFIGFPVFSPQKKELFHLCFFSVGLFSSGSIRSFTCILTWMVTSDLRLKVKTDSFPSQPLTTFTIYRWLCFLLPRKRKTRIHQLGKPSTCYRQVSLSLSILPMYNEWLLWTRYCSSTWI